MELTVHAIREWFCIWVMLQVILEPQLCRFNSRHAIWARISYPSHGICHGAHTGMDMRWGSPKLSLADFKVLF